MITYTAKGCGKQAESTCGESVALISLAKKCQMKTAYSVSLTGNVAKFYDRQMTLIGTLIVTVKTRY